MWVEKIKENKKKVIVAIFISLGLAGALWVIRKPSPAPPLPSPQPPPWSTTYPNPPLVHYPITEERCRSIKDSYQRQLCFEDLKYLRAVWEKDLKKCEELRDSQKKDDCINLVIKAKVVEPENSPVKQAQNCQKIADKKIRDICIVTAAVDSLDRKVCEYFFADEPFEKKECLDKVKAFDIIKNAKDPYKDIKKCAEVKTLEYGTICFRALLKKIKYDCNALEGMQKQMCQSLVLKRNAKTLEDCQKIPLKSYRKVCIRIIETGKSGFALDSDNDGKSDEGELFYNLDPFNPDTDGDGLLDGQEIFDYETDPTNKDTDGDGISDFEEVKRGTDPNKINH